MCHEKTDFSGIRPCSEIVLADSPDLQEARVQAGRVDNIGFVSLHEDSRFICESEKPKGKQLKQR